MFSFSNVIAKLLAKRTILVFAGSGTDILEIAGDGLYKVTKMLRKVNCKLSDQIIVYSLNLEKEWGLGSYQNKIIIAHEHHINFDIFKVDKKYSKRNNIIGFVGSLSEQKGVFHFAEAIPLIVDKMSKYRLRKSELIEWYCQLFLLLHQRIITKNILVNV